MKTCLNCDTEIESQELFCSQKCKEDFQGLHHSNDDNLKCHMCESPLVNFDNIEDLKRFCSPECHQEYLDHKEYLKSVKEEDSKSLDHDHSMDY